jgi:hypothetical protein
MTCTLNPTLHCADEPFVHDRVLKTFVLDEQRVLRAIDEPADSIAAGPGTPHEVAPVPRREWLSIPVGFKAVDDFGDVVPAGRDDGVVARFVEILLHPVQRPDHSQLVVDDHRLLVGHGERRVSVDDSGAGAFEPPPRGFVVTMPVSPGTVQDRSHLHASLRCGDHGAQQSRVREHEHLDTQRVRRLADCLYDRLGRVVGQDDQGP